MKFDPFSDPVLWSIGTLPVTQAMCTALAVSVILAIGALQFSRAVVVNPYGWIASLAELTYEALDGLVTDIIGRSVPWLVAFSGSLFLFIAASNVAGHFPGVHPPTANLGTTSALAVLVFLTVPVAGIASQGAWGYFRHYLQPNPVLLPLHLISEVSRTFALSMRLFGNIMSGHLVVALLVALCGVIVPVPLMALDLLIGLLQAYIFTILATVYIGAALRSGEES